MFVLRVSCNAGPAPREFEFSTANDAIEARSILFDYMPPGSGFVGIVEEVHALNGQRIPTWLASHVAYLGQTHKIAAIKLLRSWGDVGLKEAKDAVDAILSRV